MSVQERRPIRCFTSSALRHLFYSRPKPPSAIVLLCMSSVQATRSLDIARGLLLVLHLLTEWLSYCLVRVVLSIAGALEHYMYTLLFDLLALANTRLYQSLKTACRTELLSSSFVSVLCGTTIATGPSSHRDTLEPIQSSRVPQNQDRYLLAF